MTKLKLGPIPDEKPVKLTVELPAQLHRDLFEGLDWRRVYGRRIRPPAAAE